jgi:hypothetical protein
MASDESIMIELNKAEVTFLKRLLRHDMQPLTADSEERLIIRMLIARLSDPMRNTYHAAAFETNDFMKISPHHVDRQE